VTRVEDFYYVQFAYLFYATVEKPDGNKFISCYSHVWAQIEILSYIIYIYIFLIRTSERSVII